MAYFTDLETYLNKLPGMAAPVAAGTTDDGFWWVKFSLDTEHVLTWRVVQELAHVVNYISIHERLPTIFYPVSPPPYLNGGPGEFLSWVIESKDREFTPAHLCQWLQERLPGPVDEEDEWALE